jgi:pantetheine-phosphate adenylyltransferase
VEIIAVYPGTFDPITQGHLDVIHRGLRLFSKVIVAVATHPEKKPLFDVHERVEMIREVLGENDRVEVEGFTGLLVDFVREKRAHVVLRGLRSVTDFEYELQMAQMNREMEPGVETVFIPAGLDVNFLSSTLIKEVARSGGNVSEWLPASIARKLQEKVNRAGKSTDENGPAERG